MDPFYTEQLRSKPTKTREFDSAAEKRASIGRDRAPARRTHAAGGDQPSRADKSKQKQINEKQNFFHLLLFIFPNRGFSTCYGGFK
jgi:hypothetical protein